jgi:hypothetical protein
MPVHDSYARTTPFELLLPTEGFAEEWFPKIREEAEGRGGSLQDPESFLLLGEAAMALREIRGEDDPPELMQQHGALLFQAFHFFEAGMPLYLLDTEVVRYVVGKGPGEGEWSPTLPGRAGYLQLPHHLIWTVGGEDEPPESLDGIFWSAPEGDDISLLIVMGIRKDRPGLAVVPLPMLPLTAASPWVSMSARPDGEDFQSSLPGAELEGLYSVASGAEALKLAMRIFWYLDSVPGSLSDGVGDGEGGEGGSAEGPKASALPYRRVVVGGK